MFKKTRIKIMSVVGARPNFMKAASIAQAIEDYNISKQYSQIEHLIVHTGQHYDDYMSSLFFEELGLPKPHINLDVGSASHAQQTALIMERFEPILFGEQPDVLLVVGDVNSTIACTLVASKIEYLNTTHRSSIPIRHSRRRPLIGHVEAGLRSFDRNMPEEINRILTDQLSDFLFVSEPSGLRNLKKEGFKNFLYEEDVLKINRVSHLTSYDLPVVAFVGNTMIDTLIKHSRKAKNSNILENLGLKNSATHAQPSNIIPYAVLTLHRPSNVDHRETFKNIMEGLAEISKDIPIFFPVHPRTLNYIKEFNFENHFHFNTRHSTPHTHHSGIICIDPLGYLDFLCLMSHAKLVLTDSGGIQEETTVLGIPCVTLRENTERPITILNGTNVLSGVQKEKIIKSAFLQLKKYGKFKSSRNPGASFRNWKLALPPFWDGHAGRRIVQILLRYIQKESSHI